MRELIVRRARLTARVATLAAACVVGVPVAVADAPTGAHTRVGAYLRSTTVTGATLQTPASETAKVTVGGVANVPATSTTQGFLGIATELTTIPSSPRGGATTSRRCSNGSAAEPSSASTSRRVPGPRASSLSVTRGATLAGQSLSSHTGQLAGTPSLTLISPNATGVYAVRVPAHAAAILTLSP